MKTAVGHIRRSGWRRGKSLALLVSLVVSACVMALAMGTTRFSWLAWFSLLPLFIAMRFWRPVLALPAGAFWGLSLCVFSGFGTDAGFALSLKSLVLLTSIPAAYVCAGAWLTGRVGFNPFVLGVGWMGVELALRPAGIQSGLLGGVEAGMGAVGWVSSALGYVLVAFLVASVNASLVSALSGVNLPAPSLTTVIRPEDAGHYPFPYFLTFFPQLGVTPSNPRAPPNLA